MNKIREFFRNFLECAHKEGFYYRGMGGKGCPYTQCPECPGDCSIPVYEVYCPDCKKSWILGEDELINFFASRMKEPK